MFSKMRFTAMSPLTVCCERASGCVGDRMESVLGSSVSISINVFNMTLHVIQ